MDTTSPSRSFQPAFLPSQADREVDEETVTLEAVESLDRHPPEHLQHWRSSIEINRSLHDLFKEHQIVWLHGEIDGNRTACEEYIAGAKQKQKYRENIYWLNAGESVEELLLHWKTSFKKNLQLRSISQEGYPAAFEGAYKEKPYLIVITGLQAIHLAVLCAFLDQVRKENHHYLLISEQQLHESSVTFQRNEANYESQLPSLVSLESKEPSIIKVLKTLSHFSNKMLRVELLQLLFPDKSDVFKKLQSYGVIRARAGGEFSLHKAVIDHFLHDNEESNTICNLARLLRHNLDSPFTDSTKGWIIPYIEEFFLRNNNNHNIDPQTFIHLGSMMLDIGHYYTQNNCPVLAQEVSHSLRNAIEDFVSRELNKKEFEFPIEKCPVLAQKVNHSLRKTIKKSVDREIKKKGFKFPLEKRKYKEGIKKMGKLHPHLPFLYINVQYQIGRCYFYHKQPHERLGSFACLHYAHEIAKCLDKESILTVLIERNGLLFHKMEEENYKDAIDGYQRLLDLDQVYLDPDYKTGKFRKIIFKEDGQHRRTCLKYLIQAKTKAGEPLRREIAVLEKELRLETPRPRAFFSASMILAEAQLKQRKPQQALDKLVEEKGGLSHDQMLLLLEIKIRCHVALRNKKQLKESAEKYRSYAQKYYPEGYRAIYDAFVYEKNSEIFEEGLSYLKYLDRLLRKNGQKLKIVFSDYSILDGKLVLKILSGDAKSLFQSNRFLEEIVSVNPEGLEIQFDPVKIGRCLPRIKELLRDQNPRKIQPIKRELKEIESPEGIKLVAGEDRKLFIAFPLVELLKKRQEWERLKKELVKPGNITDGTSRYFSSVGYRLKLKDDTSDLHLRRNPTPLDIENASKPEEESWSDDEWQVENLEEKIRRFKEKEEKTKTRNQVLEERTTFYPPSASSQKESSTLRQFEKKLEEFQKAVQVKLGIPKKLEGLTQWFREQIETDNPYNLDEYIDAYIQNRNVVLQRIRDRDVVLLKKIDSELQALKARKAYLKYKKEHLAKRRAYHSLKQQEAFCEKGGTELVQSFTQATQVKTVRATSQPVDCSRSTSAFRFRAEQLHFDDPHSFIYHTLKHQEPPPFRQEDQTVVFDEHRFRENAEQYLKNVRSIIKGNALVCAIPDQHNPHTVNYRYLRFGASSPEDIHEILSLQKKIEEKNATIASLQREINNIKYAAAADLQKEITKEEATRLNHLKQQHQIKNNDLKEKLKSLSKQSRERRCDFTVLASEELENGTRAFFKTYFSRRFEIGKLPDVRVVYSLKPDKEFQ